mgnify:CR=1 FL=1
MQILLICLAVEAALFGAAYLAACAGADRWLTLREWWGRAAQQANALRLHQAATQGDATAERRYSAMPDRQPGENRAAHRARLKAERRASKVKA